MAVVMLSSCIEKEPFFTAGEDDAPRILNTDIPEWVNGEPGQLASIERTTNFTFTLIVTPVHYTTVVWNIDGKDVAEGTEVNIPLLAGNHLGKVTVTTTKGLQTSRTFTVAVRPAEGDPILENIEANRLTAPGQTVALQGAGLGNVEKVFLDETEASVTKVTPGKIDITVPASIANGVYSVILQDDSGTRYGGVYAVTGEDGTRYSNYTLTVSNAPFVTEASFRCKSGGNATATGINLDRVSTITVGGKDAAIVSKNATTLVFTCPELESGSYDITATCADGAVMFAGAEKGTMVVTSEVTLWEGSFNVTWGTPFDLLKEQFPTLVSAGTIVRAYVTGNGQGSMTTSWWNNILTGLGDPDRGDIAISGDMVLEYTLTEYSMQLMNEQNGAFFVGDGYTIKMITAE